LQLIQNIDSAVVLFVQNNLRGGLLDAVMVFFTTLGNAGLIWIFSAFVLLFTKKHRYRGFLILMCVGVAFAVNNLLIKNLVMRPRPYETLTALTALVKYPVGYSFPSGHACSSFAAAFAVTRGYGKRGAWIYVVATIIAVSRVYVGVHYPTDVLVGAVIGTAAAAGTYVFADRHLKLPDFMHKNG
jgi:undecaprenyl-diphosphatase